MPRLVAAALAACLLLLTNSPAVLAEPPVPPADRGEHQSGGLLGQFVEATGSILNDFTDQVAEASGFKLPAHSGAQAPASAPARHQRESVAAPRAQTPSQAHELLHNAATKLAAASARNKEANDPLLISALFMAASVLERRQQPTPVSPPPACSQTDSARQLYECEQEQLKCEATLEEVSGSRLEASTQARTHLLNLQQCEAQVEKLRQHNDTSSQLLSKCQVNATAVADAAVAAAEARSNELSKELELVKNRLQRLQAEAAEKPAGMKAFSASCALSVVGVAALLCVCRVGSIKRIKEMHRRHQAMGAIVTFDQMLPGTMPVLVRDRSSCRRLFAFIPMRLPRPEGRGVPLHHESCEGKFLQRALQQVHRAKDLIVIVYALSSAGPTETELEGTYQSILRYAVEGVCEEQIVLVWRGQVYCADSRIAEHVRHSDWFPWFRRGTARMLANTYR